VGERNKQALASAQLRGADRRAARHDGRGPLSIAKLPTEARRIVFGLGSARERRRT